MIDNNEGKKISIYESQGTPMYEETLHDMKTPMSLMHTFINELETRITMPEKYSIEETLESLGGVRKYWFRVMKMIGDATDSGRLSNRQMTPSLVNLDMVYVARDLVHSTKVLSARKNIAMEFKTDVEVCFMAADKHIFERILLNLLSNAIKFTGEYGKIVVNVSKTDGMFCLTVKDNGVGIERDKLSKIFDRRYTEISENNRNGSGLGLYIVKQLITLLDGEILVNSHIGTEITIRIPIRTVDSMQSDLQRLTNFYNDNIIQIELSEVY